MNTEAEGTKSGPMRMRLLSFCWVFSVPPLRSAQSLHAHAQSYFRVPLSCSFRREEEDRSAWPCCLNSAPALLTLGTSRSAPPRLRSAQPLHAYAQSYFRAPLSCSFRREEEDRSTSPCCLLSAPPSLPPGTSSTAPQRLHSPSDSFFSAAVSHASPGEHAQRALAITPFV